MPFSLCTERIQNGDGSLNGDQSASSPLHSIHPGMGANLFENECSFRVWTPNAIAVSVCIWHEEQIFQVALAPEPNNSSYWSADVAGITAGQPYQFSIVNKGDSPSNPGGVFTRVDAYARQVESAEHNARGIVVDWRQKWSEFATPKFEDLIIYEAHVGSFAGLNDHLNISTYATFADFETKLGYIRELGFNALQLLPIGQVDGIDGEGYGATNLFAPHNGYGTPAQLRSLVDAAHRNGLAVIFDVVYHHASSSHNHYWQYDGNTTDGGGIYFEDPFRYEPVRDEDGRSFAHWKSEVQNFLLDHARMLLNEYRGDGLRFDMAHSLTWACTQHIIAGLRENPYWRDKYFIAEWTSEQQDHWSQVIRELGFNAVWGMSDPFAFHRAVNGENALNELKSFIGWMGFDRPWNFIRYLLGSHDRIADSQSGRQSDNRYFVELYGGRNNWDARAKARLGWALNVAMPGTPMLFMGTECHHWGYWWPNLDGNSATSDHRFDWGIAGDSIGIPMRNLVRDINWLRWHNLSLRSDTLQFIHEDCENTVLAFKRWHEGGNTVVVVVNLSDQQWQEHNYGIDMNGETGQWEEIFNSQSPQYGGWNDSGNYKYDLQVQENEKLYVNLPKWSVLIFRKK
jgi:1,4-alpha-glucan branching enzyme